MSPKLPPNAQMARWAVKYGPLVLPYAKRLYDHGRFRQLAILHARTLRAGTFSWEMVGGERVWVVWSGDDVVATYPDRPDLRDREGHPFPGARRDRRQDPGELPTQRTRRWLSALPLPSLGTEVSDHDEAPVVGEVETAAEAELHGPAAGARPSPPPQPPPPRSDSGRTRDHHGEHDAARGD